MLYFNADNGYLEGVLRGHRSSLLTTTHYLNLSQCESLEDIKLQLGSTDYGNFLANEPPPLTTTVIQERLTEFLVRDFDYLRNNATGTLTRFLDYITYQYMIDNVILLITGTLHERDTSELLDKCHPLGWFDSMPALCVATTVQELYNLVLVDTPLAPYFKACLSSHDLDELNIEIIRNTLYKSYLEDFRDFCVRHLDTDTAEVMSEVLAFEADRRIINITINSFGTELSKEERGRLYPRIGLLWPEGCARLAKVDDADGVRAVCESYQMYRPLFDVTAADSKTLEDRFFEREVQLNRLTFMRQFQYGVFYGWLKLKEQEIRNIVWICECVQQNQRERIGNYVPIF
ncbi:H(+)-transporting V0 sector ATPase subunit d [Sorochytrium milnesiophthora]